MKDAGDRAADLPPDSGDERSPAPGETWHAERVAVLRDALAVGAATGAYGVSFGAIANTAGFSAAQASALSLLMFTGASQFALVGIVAAGGSAASAAGAAALLGSRNAFYGLSLAPRLGAQGLRRLLAAQLVIDESAAMATTRDRDQAARLAFWSTGLSVFVLWNIATVVGALGAEALADPSVLGLDAAAPAAFLALLAPRLGQRELLFVALGSGVVALVLTPLLPAGLAVLAAAVLAVLVGLRFTGSRSDE